MSPGEMIYFTFVLLAFAAFIGAVGFISIWSRGERTKAGKAEHKAESQDQATTIRRAA